MRAVLCSIALLVTTSTAQSQSWPDWISAEGRLALGYSDRTAGADAFLVGDAMLRFAPEFAGRFGLEIGTYGRADALDTPHETYGSLTFDVGNGLLAVGVPRPAYDSFAVSALHYHFPSLAIDRTAATRSEATQGAMFANYLPYGARYQNGTSNLRFAASAHHSASPDRTMASFGIATGTKTWIFEGALEVGMGGSTDVSAKAQALGVFDDFAGGIGYYAPGAFAGSDLVELFGSYKPWKRVTLSGVVQIPVDGTSDPTGGIAARYGFGNGMAMSLGVASDAGSDAVISTFVDWTF